MKKMIIPVMIIFVVLFSFSVMGVTEYALTHAPGYGTMNIKYEDGDVYIKTTLPNAQYKKASDITPEEMANQYKDLPLKLSGAGSKEEMIVTIFSAAQENKDKSAAQEINVYRTSSSGERRYFGTYDSSGEYEDKVERYQKRITALTTPETGGDESLRRSSPTNEVRSSADPVGKQITVNGILYDYEEGKGFKREIKGKDYYIKYTPEGNLKYTNINGLETGINIEQAGYYTYDANGNLIVEKSGKTYFSKNFNQPGVNADAAKLDQKDRDVVTKAPAPVTKPGETPAETPKKDEIPKKEDTPSQTAAEKAAALKKADADAKAKAAAAEAAKQQTVLDGQLAKGSNYYAVPELGPDGKPTGESVLYKRSSHYGGKEVTDEQFAKDPEKYSDGTFGAQVSLDKDETAAIAALKGLPPAQVNEFFNKFNVGELKDEGYTYAPDENGNIVVSKKNVGVGEIESATLSPNGFYIEKEKTESGSLLRKINKEGKITEIATQVSATALKTQYDSAVGSINQIVSDANIKNFDLDTTKPLAEQEAAIADVRKNLVSMGDEDALAEFDAAVKELKENHNTNPNGKTVTQKIPEDGDTSKCDSPDDACKKEAEKNQKPFLKSTIVTRGRELLNSMTTYASLGTKLYRLFGGEDSDWLGFAEEVHKSSDKDGLLSYVLRDEDYEIRKICQYNLRNEPGGATSAGVDYDINPILFADYGGRQVVAAYVNGEKSEAFPDENGTMKRVYKMGAKVSAIQEEIRFNIELRGSRTVELYDEDVKLLKGDTFERKGSDLIVKMSENNYNKVCIVVSTGAGNFIGIEGNELCATITSDYTGMEDFDFEAASEFTYEGPFGGEHSSEAGDLPINPNSIDYACIDNDDCGAGDICSDGFCKSKSSASDSGTSTEDEADDARQTQYQDEADF